MGRRRNELYHYEPTADWVRSRNPKTKTEIIAWYKKARTELKRRLQGAIQVKMRAYTVIVDRETNKPVRKSKKPQEYIIEKNRLSEQDYKVYLRLLEERFKEIKHEHNRRVKERRERSGASKA